MHIWNIERKILLNKINFEETKEDPLGEFQNLEFLGRNVFVVHFEKKLFLCNIQAKARQLILQNSIKYLVKNREKIMVCDSNGLRVRRSFSGSMSTAKQPMDYPEVEKVSLFGVDCSLYLLAVPHPDALENLDDRKFSKMEIKKYFLVYNPAFDLAEWQKKTKSMQEISEDSIFDEMIKEFRDDSIIFSSPNKVDSVKVFPHARGSEASSVFTACIALCDGKCYKVVFKVNSKKEILADKRMISLPDLPIKDVKRKQQSKEKTLRKSPNKKNVTGRSSRNEQRAPKSNPPKFKDWSKNKLPSKSSLDDYLKSELIGKSGVRLNASNMRNSSLMGKSRLMGKSYMTSEQKNSIVFYEGDHFPDYPENLKFKENSKTIRQKPKFPKKDNSKHLSNILSQKKYFEVPVSSEPYKLTIHNFICNEFVDLVVYS